MELSFKPVCPYEVNGGALGLIGPIIDSAEATLGKVEYGGGASPPGLPVDRKCACDAVNTFSTSMIAAMSNEHGGVFWLFQKMPQSERQRRSNIRSSKL